jgi:hypothetical protein
MPEVQMRFEGYLIRETAGWLLGTPPRFHTYERSRLLLLPMPQTGRAAHRAERQYGYALDLLRPPRKVERRPRPLSR